MNDTVDLALPQWGLSGSEYRLAAARENAVFEVTSSGARYALRLHRAGYRTNAELASELDWMAAMADRGVSVPAPVAAQNGAYLCEVNGTQVDVLTWLPGRTLEDALELAAPSERRSLFFSLGADMAQLHLASDDWTPPPGFDRPAWNAEGMLGEPPLWDRFWNNPALPETDRDMLLQFRTAAQARLDEIGPALDYGLIHADLVAANVLVENGKLSLIDFDDGGFGYRLFEIATALLKHRTARDQAALRESLIEGYQSVRALDFDALDLFLALRAATYVGWNISRMEEDGGRARNSRFVQTSLVLARRFLEKVA